MKKLTLSIIALGVVMPHVGFGAYCLGTCGSTTARTTFCNNETLWCGSSGLDGIGNTNISYPYCMPIQGDIKTPTSSTYIVCFSDLASCENRNWKANIEGRELSTGMSCSSAGSTSTTTGVYNIWRCTTGYYSASGKTTVAGMSAQSITCNQCPPSGGVYGTTSGPGATAITQCYLPGGTTGTDDTGAFTYTGDCYYVE